MSFAEKAWHKTKRAHEKTQKERRDQRLKKYQEESESESGVLERVQTFAEKLSRGFQQSNWREKKRTYRKGKKPKKPTVY